jgi:hypothetical protein
LSRHRPAVPSWLKRSCQRQMAVFALPIRRMISGLGSDASLPRELAFEA